MGNWPTRAAEIASFRVTDTQKHADPDEYDRQVALLNTSARLVGGIVVARHAYGAWEFRVYAPAGTEVEYV